MNITRGSGGGLSDDTLGNPETSLISSCIFNYPTTEREALKLRRVIVYPIRLINNCSGQRLELISAVAWLKGTLDVEGLGGGYMVVVVVSVLLQTLTVVLCAPLF